MKKKLEFPACTNEKVPEAEGPFYHRIDVQTRFNDYDMFGHMNNNVYMQLLDMAKVSYFEAVTGGPMKVNGVCTVIVNVNVSFYSPSLPGEPLTVVTRCTKVSVHSFILEQRVLNPQNGDVKCVAVTVMAGFDIATMQGAPIPEDWAVALRNWDN